MAIWDRDKSLLGFLYNPYLDRPLTKEQLLKFYAETKRVRSNIIDMLKSFLNDGDKQQLMNKINQTAFVTGEFSESALGLLLGLFKNKHLDKLAICRWCDQFFARPHEKEKYCSRACCLLYDQRVSHQL